MDDVHYIPIAKTEPIAESIVLNEPKNDRKKKICIYLSFLFTILGVTSLFLFIPKNPKVSLDYISIDNNSVLGKFSFKNMNYYKVEWNNPDINLYWLPYNGQTVGSVCYGNDDSPCESNKYYKNICAIKLGEFNSDTKFKTKARTTNHKNIEMLSSTQQEIACASWMILNPYNNQPQELVTSGHVNAKAENANFGKIDIENQYYYLKV